MADVAIAKIDRVSGNGTIREHMWDGTRTLCGLTVPVHQPPAGNTPCANCDHLARAVRLQVPGDCWLGELPASAQVVATSTVTLTDGAGEALRACRDGDPWCGGADLSVCERLVAIGLVTKRDGVEGGYSLVFDDGLYAVARWEGDASPLDRLPFSIRADNVFRGERIITVGDLVQRSARDLIRLKNFGRKCLKETQEVLAVLGRSLSAKDMPPWRRLAHTESPYKYTRPVRDLPLSGRVLTALDFLKVTYVQDLVRCTAFDLLCRPGFGRGSLREVEAALATLGLALTERPTLALHESAVLQKLNDGRVGEEQKARLLKVANRVGGWARAKEPLKALCESLEGRITLNLGTAGHHPDPAVRGAALIRVDAYRLALGETKRTLALLYPDDHGDSS